MVLTGVKVTTYRHTVRRIQGWRAYPRVADLSDLRSYVAFAGFPRSGHTLIGSLLTAHPDAVVAHELDALRFVEDRFDRRALFGLIARHDREFAESGSAWTGYDYAVPGQWQGRFRSLRVIGDKKGGNTALHLHDNPGLLTRLRRTVRVPVRFVIVTRNPVDNISRMTTRNGWSAAEATDIYFRQADTVQWLLGQADCLVVRHEDFSASPASELARLVEWLELSPGREYLDACASIVRESRPARGDAAWVGSDLDRVRLEASRRSLLAEYAI